MAAVCSILQGIGDFSSQFAIESMSLRGASRFRMATFAGNGATVETAGTKVAPSAFADIEVSTTVRQLIVALRALAPS